MGIASRLAAVAAATASVSSGALAQSHGHDSTGAGRLALGAMAVLVGTRVDPAARGTPLREWYLSQPLLLARAAPNEHLVALVVWNFEGAVMRRGELSPGIYGEGYIDRRHPHTAFHEAILATRFDAGGTVLSLTAGKGFVPFGSDDPMTRPFQQFPVNHHISQILERAVLIGAARRGMVTLEGSVFNGDEPESPGDMPNLDRFGDAWSARLTLTPAAGLEASASAARVTSPEDATGHGLSQRKAHAGLRYQSQRERGLQYALVEWGRTGEYRDDRKAWDFSSTLAEASARFSFLRLAARFERTTRPDEQRADDDFRSPRPLLDFSILGRSRWDAGTVSVSAPRQVKRGLTAIPFVEMSVSRVRATVIPTTFVPVDFYGASRIWSASAGLRLHAGAVPARAGRYAAASPARR